MIDFETELNLPETEFLNAYNEWTERIDESRKLLRPQVEIGKYIVDFLYKGKYVIEIDGQAYHEGEQRQRDYIRERYLVKEGYKVIRFTATEVLKQSRQCITEMMEIVYSHANVWNDTHAT